MLLAQPSWSHCSVSRPSPAGDGLKPSRVCARLREFVSVSVTSLRNWPAAQRGWASAQSIEVPLGIHNAGCWPTGRVRRINRQRQARPPPEPRLMITSDLQRHARFTALSIKVSAAPYVTRCELHFRTTGMMELHLSDLRLFCGEIKIPMHADEPRWSLRRFPHHFRLWHTASGNWMSNSTVLAVCVNTLYVLINKISLWIFEGCCWYYNSPSGDLLAKVWDVYIRVTGFGVAKNYWLDLQWISCWYF